MTDDTGAKPLDEQGAETLWRNAIADAVIEILERDGPVTRDKLRSTLEAQRDHPGTHRYMRATLQGALNALDGRPPS